jgi:succinate-semialdehyde dehydrogenase/glutarate-semialdehyde dehydrogenase
MINYQEFGLLVDNSWQTPVKGTSYEVVNPSTEDVIGKAPQATAEDVRLVIDSAERGLRAWSATNSWERSRILRQIASNIRAGKEKIAAQISLEVGKPLAQARGEVEGGAEQFDWFADETRRIYGHVIESRLPSTNHQVRYAPVGIVAAFTPWNFPVALAARKLAPALAAGCSIICRGAEEAPGSAMLLLKCCADAGLPAGAVSLLVGAPAPITDALMVDGRVKKVSFTGSVPVGKLIAARAAETLKRVTMELGGHSPVILLDDVDVARVAKLSAQAKFRNGGQVCIAPSRFFVARSIYEQFISCFAAEVEKLVVGRPGDSPVDMGPLATRRRYEAIDALTKDAVAKGARVVTGGGPVAGFDRGFFYAPTVLGEVPASARVLQEEIFGPIAPVVPVDSLEEAMTAANSVPLGLNSYLFTKSLRSAEEAISGLDVGMVTINSFAPAMTEVPFGGVKDSGYGREGGSLGIRDYLEAKTVTLTYV